MQQALRAYYPNIYSVAPSELRQARKNVDGAGKYCSSTRIRYPYTKSVARKDKN